MRCKDLLTPFFRRLVFKEGSKNCFLYFSLATFASLPSAKRRLSPSTRGSHLSRNQRIDRLFECVMLNFRSFNQLDVMQINTLHWTFGGGYFGQI